MKVSQEKKREIRKKLINSAVEVIMEKGFNAATMREIAVKAGLGTATIYHYFPSKEKILYAYFEEKHLELEELLKKIPDFDGFSLNEKLQTQMESLLGLYLEEREFVQEAFKLIFDSPLKTFTQFAAIKELFTARVREYFKKAYENNEIQEQEYENFIINLYWDYSIIIILYWLRDDSEGFSNTSRIIDISLGVFVDFLKINIVTRTADIFSFIFKSHLYNNIDRIHQFFSMPFDIGKKINTHAKKNKNNFSGTENDGQKR